jgi:gamma-glutamylcysteine synthetase
MPDDKSSASDSKVTIADELRAKFPDLVQLILSSESMNDEERQYWVNILPIMTPEQVQNLRDILDNEKKQLADIDKKYSSQIDASTTQESIAKTGASRKKRRDELSDQEEKHEKSEDAQTEDLLNKIDQL